MLHMAHRALHRYVTKSVKSILFPLNESYLSLINLFFTQILTKDCWRNIHNNEYFCALCLIFLVLWHKYSLYCIKRGWLFMTQEELGRRIAERRHILDVDQKTAAALSGVSVHTLSNIESGKGNPSLKILCKMADALGLELRMDVKKQPE